MYLVAILKQTSKANKMNGMCKIFSVFGIGNAANFAPDSGMALHQ